MGTEFTKGQGEREAKNRVGRGNFAIGEGVAEWIIDKGHKPGRLAGINERVLEPPQSPDIFIGITCAADLVEKVEDDRAQENSCQDQEKKKRQNCAVEN